MENVKVDTVYIFECKYYLSSYDIPCNDLLEITTAEDMADNVRVFARSKGSHE